MRIMERSCAEAPHASEQHLPGVQAATNLNRIRGRQTAALNFHLLEDGIDGAALDHRHLRVVRQLAGHHFRDGVAKTGVNASGFEPEHGDAIACPALDQRLGFRSECDLRAGDRRALLGIGVAVRGRRA
jgi:hypothetical protein